MSPPPGDGPKDALRRRLRARLKPLRRDAPRAAESSGRLRRHLASGLPEALRRAGAGPVATFAPLAGEPDLLPLLEEFDSIGWVFPRVEGDDLAFYPASSRSRLLPGTYGILEPAPRTGGGVPAGQIALFLVPGLGFDPATGARLGRGRGYYDRALAATRPGSLRIGVGFDLQFTAVPAESHDQPMDALVSESGWRWIRPA